MSFQISRIVLYNSDGEVRDVEFRPGQLNIITGASKTGKSSIIQILDYCLGSTRFAVAAGVIRDVVVIYGVILETTDGQQILITRPKPSGRQLSTGAMHVQIGDFRDSLPSLVELRPNTEVGAVRGFLSELLGITETELGGPESYSASIRHALYFVFQGQAEIANPDILFHTQAEEWAPRAIRDTFPYFLGAVDEEQILKQARIRSLTRQLRALTREDAEIVSIVGTTATVSALISQAAEVGLIPEQDVPPEQGSALSLLTAAAFSQTEPSPDVPDRTAYLDLLDRGDQLRQQLADRQAELRLLEHVVHDRLEFVGEAREQAGRLAALELLPGTSDRDNNTCPLCDSNLEVSIPSVDELRSALSLISAEIGEMDVPEPQVQSVRAALSEQISAVSDEIRLNSNEVTAIQAVQRSLANFRDEAVRRAAVQGRIGLYLDSVRSQVAQTVVSDQVDDLRRELAALQSDLDAATIEESLESILSRVNRDISAAATRLQLEHSESPSRLDIRKLTVIADTPAGPVSLREMGSGENWLGYHLATLEALHSWFIAQNRPVPRFLVLDQPSQVYFPPDSVDEEAPPVDEDRIALSRVFNEINQFVSDHEGTFQIIVVDHADLQESWFQDAVIDRWRDGEALIPSSWLQHS